jgi:hypothetical protein
MGEQLINDPILRRSRATLTDWSAPCCLVRAREAMHGQTTTWSATGFRGAAGLGLPRFRGRLLIWGSELGDARSF